MNLYKTKKLWRFDKEAVTYMGLYVTVKKLFITHTPNLSALFTRALFRIENVPRSLSRIKCRAVFFLSLSCWITLLVPGFQSVYLFHNSSLTFPGIRYNKYTYCVAYTRNERCWMNDSFDSPRQASKHTKLIENVAFAPWLVIYYCQKLSVFVQNTEYLWTVFHLIKINFRLTGKF